jgi:hypothetical protein
MFKDVAGETAFGTVCKCVVEICKGKIMSNPTDMLSVVLYGTKARQGDFDGIYVLQDLDVPSVELIKTMEAMSKVYPHGSWDGPEEFPLSDAFWTASSLLAKTKVQTRRVFLFTNQDTPHDERSDALEQARRRLEDFHTSNVDVQLFAFDPPGRDFRLGFYREVYERSRDYDMTASDRPHGPSSSSIHSSSQGSAAPGDVRRVDPMWKASSRLEHMLQRVRAKATPRRALTTLPMTLVLAFVDASGSLTTSPGARCGACTQGVHGST